MFYGSSPEDAMIAVDAQIEAAQERMRQASSFAAEASDLRSRARSPRGEVEVQVDASGKLMDIQFSEAAFAVEPRRLGEIVMATVAVAHRLVLEQYTAMATAAFGENSELTAHVVDEARAQLGTPPDDDSRDSPGQDWRSGPSGGGLLGGR